MSDDEGRLIIDEPNSEGRSPEGRRRIAEPGSPDEDRLYIADDSPRKDYLHMLKDMEPSGVSVGGAPRKAFDPDLTPPYMNGVKMKVLDEEAVEDGEITDELTPDELRIQMMANQHHRSSSNRISRESRDSREGRDSRNNGSIDSTPSSSRPSGSTQPPPHLYPHSRGAPGGVRSKPDPLSAPQSVAPAGHLRRSVDHERERKDRHPHSLHSHHNSVSSSSSSGVGGVSSSSHHPQIPPLMALDVPPVVPSPAEIIERGERREEKKMKENGEEKRRERNGSFSSTASSVKEEKERSTTPSTSNGITVNGRKRESICPSIGEEKDGVEPPKKKIKEEEGKEKEKRRKKSPSPPSMVSRGTSVGVQAERDEVVLDLPAGSSITLTFTVVCRAEQANPDLNNTLYLSTMVGGREMMCVLADTSLLGERRRSLTSCSSDDSGGRHGTPSKSFRGGTGTPRDKRARNGMERKRRVLAENDEEDSSADSTAGEGTSTRQRIELVEQPPKREMHHCPFEKCEFRFARSSELEYHKGEMHTKRKPMMEETACQTIVSSCSRSSIQCQTENVVLMTKEEEEKLKEEQKKVKAEPKEEIKENSAPALTIQTGVHPSASSTPSSTGAVVEGGGGSLLMKASPSTSTTTGGTQTAGTHVIHAPVALTPSSVSSTMPTLTPAISTPTTPSATSKPPRLPAGGTPSSSGAVSSPRPSIAVPQPVYTQLGGGNPHQPGTPAHALMQAQLQQLQILQNHPAFAANKGQQKGGSTQHKINELKVKSDDAVPSSSTMTHHPPPLPKPVPAPVVAPAPLPSPAVAQQQRQQPQMQPQFGFPMMGMMPPSAAQQQQQMMQMQQQAMMQQMAMQHYLQQQGNRPGPQPHQMQMPMQVTPEMMMQMQMMMQAQQQQK